MMLEDLSLALNGLASFERYWLEWELAFLLLPWEWEIFKRRGPGRLEACFGPFYIDVSLGIEMTLEELEERVYGVVERIDADPEEIEQDIRDVTEALKDYKAGKGIPFVKVLERMKKEGKL